MSITHGNCSAVLFIFVFTHFFFLSLRRHTQTLTYQWQIRFNNRFERFLSFWAADYGRTIAFLSRGRKLRLFLAVTLVDKNKNTRSRVYSSSFLRLCNPNIVSFLEMKSSLPVRNNNKLVVFVVLRKRCFRFIAVSRYACCLFSFFLSSLRLLFFFVSLSLSFCVSGLIRGVRAVYYLLLWIEW